MNNTVGVGILGLGGSRTHAGAVRELAPDLQVRAFTDGNAAQATEEGGPRPSG